MKRALFALAITAVFAGSARADMVGFFNSTNTTADALTAAAITASGNTPVPLAGLTAADLAGLDVLWILNSDNGGYGAAITNNLGAIAAFVRVGGTLSFHDRRVTEAATILPGAGGTSFHRDTVNNAADIDIVNNTTLVTNGPGGVLNNTSLDGGNLSSHGFADLATLPPGAGAILSRPDPTQIVDFFYPFSSGFVYYSTIPLDFYLTPSGNDPPGTAMRTIYAPNEVAFQASLGVQQVAVPEPATVTLFGLGALGLCGYGWRRRRAAA